MNIVGNPGFITSGTMFENIDIQDFVNIETLRRPLMALQTFEITDTTVSLTLYYQFKDFSLKKNRYKIYIWTGQSKTDVRYDDLSTWASADLDSNELGNTFTHAFSSIGLGQFMTAVVHYSPVVDVYESLPVSFTFKLPMFQLSLQEPSASPVPSPSAPFVLLDATMMVKSQDIHNVFLYSVVLSDSGIGAVGVRGTIYTFTKKSAYSTYEANGTIEINDQVHYLIGMSESMDDYQSIEDNSRVMTSFGNYFVTNLKIDENPYRESEGTEVVFVLKPFNENRYINLIHDNPVVYDLKDIAIAIQSFTFIQIPTDNVNLNTTDIGNDNTFLKFREGLDLTVTVTGAV